MICWLLTNWTLEALGVCGLTVKARPLRRHEKGVCRNKTAQRTTGVLQAYTEANGYRRMDETAHASGGSEVTDLRGEWHLPDEQQENARTNIGAAAISVSGTKLIIE